MAGIHFDITGDNEQVLKSLRQTMEAITQLGDKTEDAGGQIDKSTQKMSGLSKELATMATRYVSWAAAIGLFTKGIKDAIKLNAEFEKKNSELAAVLGTTRKGVDELSKSAEDLGRKTMFTASQVTELQVALARLGFTEGQIKDMQGSVLKFAAAVNTDLASASAFTGSVLRGFGLEAKDTTHLLDVMASATSKSALDFRKLEVSMSTVAPVAKSFGLSVEDAVALIGALSNAGFEASRSAMAAKNILLNFADANGKIAKSLGHAASSFPDIIKALKECTEKGISLSEALEMTDQQSVAAFTALINGADAANQLRDALGECDGTLNDMYDTMTDNLIGAVDELKSAWQGLMLEFQESNGTIATMLRGLAKGINLMKDWADYAQANKKEPTQFGERLSWILPGYKGAKNIFNGIKNLSAVLNQDNEQAMMDAIKNSGEFKSLEDYDKMIGEVTSALESKDYKGNKKKSLERYRDALVKLRGEAWANALNSGLESLIAELEGSGNGTGGGGGNTHLTDEQKKAIANYKKAYEKVVSQLWKSVADTSVAAMKEGHAKELAEIENERRQSLAAIDEEVKELEEAAKGAGIKVSQEVYDQYEQKRLDTNTIAANKTAEVEKKRLKELNENRWEYLQQYGNYKEKELAITEKYEAAIAEAKDEYSKKSLEKQKQEELSNLEKQYSDVYKQIFAETDVMSRSMVDATIALAETELQRMISLGTSSVEEIAEVSRRLDELRAKRDEMDFGGWGSTIGDWFTLRARRNRIGESKGDLDAQIRAKQESLRIEEIFGGGKSSAKYDQLSRELKDLQRQAGDAADAEEYLAQEMKKVAATIAATSLGDLLGQIGDAMQQIASVSGNESMSEAGEALSGIGNMVSGIAQGFAQGGLIGGIATAITTIASNAISAFTSVKVAQQEYTKSIKDFEEEINRASLAVKKADYTSLFGTRESAMAVDAYNKARSAIAKFANESRRLSGMKIKTEDYSWFANMFGKSDKYASLGSFDIWGKDGLLDVDKARAFLQTQTYITDETKKEVENVIALKEAYDDAMNTVKEYASSVLGDFASKAGNAICDAILSGKTAFKDLGQAGASVIDTLARSMAEQWMMEKYLNQFEDELTNAFGSGDANKVSDVVSKIVAGLPDAVNGVTAMVSGIYEYAEQSGIDIKSLRNNTREAATRSSLGASQDSIDESNGRLTAIQGHTYEINENVRRLVALAGLGAGTLPADMTTTPLLQNDYSGVIRQLNEQLAIHAQQLLTMGASLESVQENVGDILGAVRNIEGTTDSSLAIANRLRSGVDTIVDKGVNML